MAAQRQAGLLLQLFNDLRHGGRGRCRQHGGPILHRDLADITGVAGGPRGRCTAGSRLPGRLWGGGEELTNPVLNVGDWAVVTPQPQPPPLVLAIVAWLSTLNRLHSVRFLAQLEGYTMVTCHFGGQAEPLQALGDQAPWSLHATRQLSRRHPGIFGVSKITTPIQKALGGF